MGEFNVSGVSTCSFVSAASSVYLLSFRSAKPEENSVVWGFSLASFYNANLCFLITYTLVLRGEGAHSFLYSSPLCFLSLHSFIIHCFNSSSGLSLFKNFLVTLLTEAVGDTVSSVPQVLLSAACVSAAVPVAGSANAYSSLYCCPNVCAGAASGTAKAIWVVPWVTASPFAREGRRRAFPRSFSAGQGTSGGVTGLGTQPAAAEWGSCTNTSSLVSRDN